MGGSWAHDVDDGQGPGPDPGARRGAVSEIGDQPVERDGQRLLGLAAAPQGPCRGQGAADARALGLIVCGFHHGRSCLPFLDRSGVRARNGRAAAAARGLGARRTGAERTSLRAWTAFKQQQKADALKLFLVSLWLVPRGEQRPSVLLIGNLPEFP
jgi:hypothetical protein